MENRFSLGFDVSFHLFQKEMNLNLESKEGRSLKKSYRLLPGIWVSLLACTILGGRVEAADTELKLEGDLPAITATYKDASSLIRATQEIFSRATGGDLFESLTFHIESEGVSLSGSSFEELLSDPRLPDPAYGLRLTRYAHKSSVSQMSLWFSKSHNSYEIVGTDKLLLGALQHEVLSFTEKQTTWFAGMFPIVLVLSVIFSFGITTSLGIFKISVNRKWIDMRIYGIACTILVTILVFSGRLPYWFSMTTLYSDSASFLVRHNVVIFFWLAIFGIVLHILLAMKSWKKHTETSPSPEAKDIQN
jgi:hypothetical protein